VGKHGKWVNIACTANCIHKMEQIERNDRVDNKVMKIPRWDSQTLHKGDKDTADTGKARTEGAHPATAAKPGGSKSGLSAVTQRVKKGNSSPKKSTFLSPEGQKRSNQ